MRGTVIQWDRCPPMPWGAEEGKTNAMMLFHDSMVNCVFISRPWLVTKGNTCSIGGGAFTPKQVMVLVLWQGECIILKPWLGAVLICVGLDFLDAIDGFR